MTDSQGYIKVETLRGDAPQRLSFAGFSLGFNLILPPPTSTKQLFIISRSRDTAWHDEPCGVPASLCTTKL